MTKVHQMLLGITAGVLGPITAFCAIPTESEMNNRHTWAASIHDASAAGQLFSFVYDGKFSREFLPSWKVERTSRSIDTNQTEYTLIFTDPATPTLSVRCVAIEYTDFPAVEWVLYFKNVGNATSPVIENILPLDGGFALTRDKAAMVHHANGSECRLDDFAPHMTALGPDSRNPQAEWRGESNPMRIESKGGRSSCGAMPFFNLEMAGQGAMLAIGWTGDWAASFFRTDKEVRAQAGMKKTHFRLLPGEEVRSPRMMVLFWEGNPLRGHNQLRQFILAHHTPMVNGKRAQAPLAQATWGGNFAAKHIEHGLWWKQNSLPLDYLWVDAGWFGVDEAKVGATVFNSAWGRLVGDWFPNPGYFPEGMKPVADALKEAGVGLLIWVESERVFKGTKWTREHPEFLVGPQGDNFLFNLGDPAARKFLTDYLADLIQQNNIGCYRQDFNMDPRPFWDSMDTPDRVGIAEIKHISGMYAMWDELRERFPNLLIDNCSSGGRRIDLETISRSIPLWRSDVQCWPGFGVTAMQGQTHGLGMWVPLSTGAFDREDTYVFRSALGPGMVMIMYDFEQDTSRHFAVDWLRARLGEFETLRKYFEGDFYPLLNYALTDDVWAAWQYDRPDFGEGMVLTFRRPESPYESMRPQLRHLMPDALYELLCVDTAEKVMVSGKELMEKGPEIRIGEKPGSRILIYKKR